MALRDDVLDIIRAHPGATEREISERLHANPYQQRVNSTCRKMLMDRLVKREGRGGNADPFRYYL